MSKFQNKLSKLWKVTKTKPLLQKTKISKPKQKFTPKITTCPKNVFHVARTVVWPSFSLVGDLADPPNKFVTKPVTLIFFVLYKILSWTFPLVNGRSLCSTIHAFFWVRVGKSLTSLSDLAKSRYTIHTSKKSKLAGFDPSTRAMHQKDNTFISRSLDNNETVKPQFLVIWFLIH